MVLCLVARIVEYVVLSKYKLLGGVDL
jgi:hypothetical protein